jgi:hypothetical protein
MKRIRYSTQTISPKDIKSVKDVLKKDFLTQGPTNIKFEKKLSQYLGCKHVLSVSNASNALFLACKVVGIKKDSIVWCSTITFISSISCAYQLEAKVEFLDIDSYSFNIDLKKLEQKLKIVKKIPDLIIVTHLGGSPLDLLKLDLRETIQTIKTPVSIMAAVSIYPKKQVEELYTKQYQKLTTKEIIYVDDSAHFIMFDKQDWFIHQIKKLLK